MFVYLSYENESNNWACLPKFKRRQVYFDDMKVTHTKSNVIQYNACLPKFQRRQEYYPLGLQAGTSWTRESTYGNAYLYNEGSELNSTTGWYEMFYRGYDPALGRMFQVDPFASSFSSLTPYTYAGSNPVMFNDPSGGYMAPNPETFGTNATEYFNRVWYSADGTRHSGNYTPSK